MARNMYRNLICLVLASTLFTGAPGCTPSNDHGNEQTSQANEEPGFHENASGCGRGKCDCSAFAESFDNIERIGAAFISSIEKLESEVEKFPDIASSIGDYDRMESAINKAVYSIENITGMVDAAANNYYDLLDEAEHFPEYGSCSGGSECECPEQYDELADIASYVVELEDYTTALIDAADAVDDPSGSIGDYDSMESAIREADADMSDLRGAAGDLSAAVADMKSEFEETWHPRSNRKH